MCVHANRWQKQYRFGTTWWANYRIEQMTNVSIWSEIIPLIKVYSNCINCEILDENYSYSECYIGKILSKQLPKIPSHIVIKRYELLLPLPLCIRDRLTWRKPHVLLSSRMQTLGTDLAQSQDPHFTSTRSLNYFYGDGMREMLGNMKPGRSKKLPQLLELYKLFHLPKTV